MTHTLEHSSTLLQLAGVTASRGGRMDELFLSVTTLFENQNKALSPHEREMASDILRRLSTDVEMSIRIALAERLADDPSAPHELITLLADDTVEVATPVLMRSPVLNDADLIHIVEHCSVDHQITVAKRPNIGEHITESLSKSPSNAVLVALLRNNSARIASPTFAVLVERARDTDELQAPLVHRSDLPPVIAQRLYACVSGHLQKALTERFPQAAHSIAAHMPGAAIKARTNEPPTPEITAIKLIAKLASSGQLRTSFLIRVLHQGQMDLFEHGFASLLRIDVTAVRTALYGERVLPVAMACRAVGIDRAVFMTVLNLTNHHRGVTRLLTEADKREVENIFVHMTKPAALDRLQSSIAS